MAAQIRLIASPGSSLEEIRFVLAWAAPAEESEAPCALARLTTGDDQAFDLGLLCAPTAVTWREQRQFDLGVHRYAGAGPYTARLHWGDAIAETTVTLGTRAAGAAQAELPTVTLFAVSPVSGQPMQRLVKLRVEGLESGQRLRLDGGAAQVHWLSEGTGGTQAAEFLLEYAKPGPHRATLDLLDADGFWMATLTEAPLEITFPDELAETKPPPETSLEEPAVTALADVAAEPQPWLPYRYIKPTRYGVYTYSGPGGGTVRRSVNPGIYLSVRAETVVGGTRWFQTAQGDWIAASVVTFFRTSELRGVELGGGEVPPPPPPPPPPADTRQGVVTATVLNVRGRPGVSAGNPPVATLRLGAAVTIYEEATVSGAVWYRIGDNRWVHSAYVRLVSTTEPPATPPTSDTRRGVVTATALNVRAQPGVSASNPPVAMLRSGAEVMIYETRTVAGDAWYRIGDARWVISTWVRLLDTGTRLVEAAVAALALATPTQLPVGWCITSSRNVRVRPGVSADNPPIGELAHNQSVAILEERTVAGAKWYRIGDDQWVESSGIGVARRRTRPASIGATERWVGVCLSAQTAVAYEGDRPVYAALIASGLPGTPTVQGIFRTWLRLTTGKMSGPGYYLEDVTWTCYFYSGYSLHAAYWHDAFGSPRSHGCVNMSPYDAWWVFQWSAPGGANSPMVYVYWA